MFWLDIFFSTFYFCLALWAIRRLRFFRMDELPKSWLYGAFGLKLIASLALVIIYTRYYTNTAQNDIYRLYYDSDVLCRLLFDDPVSLFRIFFGWGASNTENAAIFESMNNWYSQGSFFTGTNRFIIRLHVIYSLFTGGSFFARFIINDFIVFSGLLLLYRFLSSEAGIRRKEIFAAVFLIPSVVFWSSGVFKEGIILTGMALLLWGSRKIFRHVEILKGLLYLLAGALLLLLTRPYMLLILLFYLGILQLRQKSCKTPLLKYVVMTLIAVMVLGLADYAFSGFNPYSLLVEKQHSFIAHAQQENAGSLVYLPELGNSPVSILKTTAVGLYNSLLRPLFFDMNSLLGFVASLENLFVLILIALSVFYFRKDNPQQNLIFFCLFVAIANMLVIGVTVPVAGAIVRYKITTLPFLLCALSLGISSHTPFLRIFRS